MSVSLPISLLSMFKNYLKARKIKVSLVIIIIIIYLTDFKIVVFSCLMLLLLV